MFYVIGAIVVLVLLFTLLSLVKPIIFGRTFGIMPDYPEKGTPEKRKLQQEAVDEKLRQAYLDLGAAIQNLKPTWKFHSRTELEKAWKEVGSKLEAIKNLEGLASEYEYEIIYPGNGQFTWEMLRNPAK